MGKYKIIYHRHGQKDEIELSEETTEEEAIDFFERFSDTDEAFVEKLIGPDRKVIRDNLKSVIGYRDEEER